MTVTVASRPLQPFTGLSEHARIVVALIEGGNEWLEWATFDPRARYHFDDEMALAAAIQAGLHARSLLWLPTLDLMVGPARLMTIHARELRVLARAERGDEDAVPRAKVILDRHRLVTQAELAGIPHLLKELGVAADEPLLQGMGFDDRLAIHAALSDKGRPGGGALGPRDEAAAFALELAQTPLEFVDYYQAYRHYPAPVRSRARDDRAARVREGIEILRPLLFQALNCPRVDGLVPPWQVAEAIGEWQMMGRLLGFSRLSQAIQQVIRHTPFVRHREYDAPEIVGRYLAGAQALLGYADFGRGAIGQDGASSTFLIESDEGDAAVVSLGADGIITLSSFRPRPARPAVHATARRST